MEFEITDKLEKELTIIEMLKERMDRSRQITASMRGILNSFESRLTRLENTIVPVYLETENLQRRQKNIEKTMAALDSVISYYTVSEVVDPIIRDGPRHDSHGETILEPFLQALQKLETAKEYFEKHSKDSMEQENVLTLLTSGREALEREFKSLLHKHSSPVKPIDLLEVATTDDESSNEDMPASLQHFPESATSSLIQIAEWLMSQGRDEYMNVYAAVRGAVMFQSIKHLRDHQKSASGGSFQNIPSISSPMAKQKFSGLKASKRLQQVLEKKANRIMQRASQTFEHSTGLTLGNRRPTALEAREDAVEESEMDNYLVTVVALQKLLQYERILMVGIIPYQHQHKVFEIIIREAMDLIVQDCENIATRAKRCMARQEFSAILVLFPILKHLLIMKPDFERTFEGCDVTVRSKFSSILNILHATGEKALDEFIENVKNDSNSQLPKDGTVHELTSNVLLFLEQVAEYTDSIGEVLTAKLGQSRGKPATPAEWRAHLGKFIKRVLAQLNNTLVNKSDLYPDVYLRAIFLLNNYHHILKSLQRSDLLKLVQLEEPECEAEYQKKIEINRKFYSQCWSKVLSYIYSSEDTGPIQSGKIRDRDRTIIKDKFAGFNKELDEISRTQRNYSVPDTELRESLKRDNKELILPKYSAFYDKYSTVPFSKNVEKYVKYSPSQVSAMVDRLFDISM